MQVILFIVLNVNMLINIQYIIDYIYAAINLSCYYTAVMLLFKVYYDINSHIII